MKRIKIDIKERLAVEANIQRLGEYSISVDPYGNRIAGRGIPDTDMADLLDDALKRIQKLEKEVDKANLRISATQEDCFRDGIKFERDKIIAYLNQERHDDEWGCWFARAIKEGRHKL